MGKLAVDKFLVLAGRSGLVEKDRLDSLVEQWKRQATAEQLDDAMHCGAFLVRNGAITAWQCHKLLDGRHRGFMLGNYKLLDHLGSGGMSNVYLAEHVLMQRLVAIKVLPENRVADASYLARFHFEGQAVAALDHPNIVRAYDLGSEGRIHYFVMEYVDGSNLEALVERKGPLPFHTAARYVKQAADGLEHAHRAGLVHRDVKPANLLVDRQGTVKVLDLGLARFKPEVRPVPEFARDEQVLGTAAYFAPEQAVDSRKADSRADIYGLGCTLYFLLTGHPPFRGESAVELATAHHRQDAPEINVERPDAPAELVAICEKMMQKLPTDRFQSAHEVANALENWLQSERAAGRSTDADQSFDRDVMQTATAWGDTDQNLQDTARIERLAKQIANQMPSSSAHANASEARPPQTTNTESDVIVPPMPPPPPVVPPPRAAHSSAIPVVPSASVTPVAPPRESDFDLAPYRHQAPRVSASKPIVRRSRAGQLWSVIALATLTLGAILFALYALAN